MSTSCAVSDLLLIAYSNVQNAKEREALHPVYLCAWGREEKLIQHPERKLRSGSIFCHRRKIRVFILQPLPDPVIINIRTNVRLSEGGEQGCRARRTAYILQST